MIEQSGDGFNGSDERVIAESDLDRQNIIDSITDSKEMLKVYISALTAYTMLVGLEFQRCHLSLRYGTS